MVPYLILIGLNLLTLGQALGKGKDVGLTFVASIVGTALIIWMHYSLTGTYI